mmetsp:Transcript_76798/g.212199  ORF Transcript_76798/g.212199 Transcript_76798/m.212199 type:complete len:368 (+) Transcript_76798:222-1325(+)
MRSNFQWSRRRHMYTRGKLEICMVRHGSADNAAQCVALTLTETTLAWSCGGQACTAPLLRKNSWSFISDSRRFLSDSSNCLRSSKTCRSSACCACCCASMCSWYALLDVTALSLSCWFSSSADFAASRSSSCPALNCRFCSSMSRIRVRSSLELWLPAVFLCGVPSCGGAGEMAPSVASPSGMRLMMVSATLSVIPLKMASATRSVPYSDRLTPSSSNAFLVEVIGTFSYALTHVTWSLLATSGTRSFSWGNTKVWRCSPFFTPGGTTRTHFARVSTKRSASFMYCALNWWWFSHTPLLASLRPRSRTTTSPSRHLSACSHASVAAKGCPRGLSVTVAPGTPKARTFRRSMRPSAAAASISSCSRLG